MSSGSAPPYAGSQPVALTQRHVVTARLADYLELTKPRIATMALVTVVVGYTVGSQGDWQLLPLLNALFGIGLVAASSSIINQWMERDTDRRMVRTANRPLPSGRMTSGEALVFGIVTGVIGTVWLLVQVNLLTAALAVATLLLYTAVYTPLKRRTSLCTAIGAVPGALPPVLGWTAAQGTLDASGLSLFWILFLWQFPHFLAIAWLYRHDYAQAGLRMLPAFAPAPRVTGMMAVAYALVLLPVSLLPREFALAGNAYAMVAVVLGAGYLLCALRFLAGESVRTARGLLWSSLIYLPLLLLVLTWDHLRLLR